MKRPSVQDAKNTTCCPVCPKPVTPGDDHYPFCSARCRAIDLGRWMDESYKITRPIEQRDLEEGVD